MTTSAPASSEAVTADPRRWSALFVLLAAAFMDLLDATVVNIALPTIRVELGASYAAIQWITAGYTLAFGLGLITGGRMGDRFGRKRIFLIGTAAFTLASLLCGIASTAAVLVVARLLQGLAAALMVPQIMATVYAIFPPAERGGATGAYGAATGLATVAGPVVAGLLVQYDLFGLGWRAVFLINLPIGVIAFVTALKLVPENRSEHPLRMDLIGALLVTLGMVLVLYPLVQGNEAGWPSWMFVAMAASPVVMLVYALHARAKDRRDGSALVPLRLFGQPGFAAGTVLLFLFDATMIGFTLVLTLSLQIGLGFSPVSSGLVFIPWAIGSGIMAGMADKLIAKLGRHLLSIGAVVMAAGIVWTALTVTPDSSWYSLWPSLFVTGLGLGGVIGPAFTVAGSGVRPSDAGAASGTLSAATQVGAAAGTALLSVVFFNLLVGAPAEGPEHAETFLAAFRNASWYAAGGMLLIALLSQALPRRVAGYHTMAH